MYSDGSYFSGDRASAVDIALILFAYRIDVLLETFANVKQMIANGEGPILVHAVTEKGHGYEPAEQDPFRYHGVGSFDVDTGEVLWKTTLPAGGQAVPMTYAINGRQIVVIAAGGYGRIPIDMGDSLVAFALPAD